MSKTDTAITAYRRALSVTEGDEFAKETVFERRGSRIFVRYPGDEDEQSFATEELLSLAAVLVTNQDEPEIEDEDDDEGVPPVEDPDDEIGGDDEPEIEEATDPDDSEYRQLAEAVKSGARRSLEVGMIVARRLSRDETYEQVKDRLRQKYSVELPSEGAISKWSKAARAWVTESGADLDEISRVGVYKLYYAADSVNSENWPSVLRDLESMTKAEVEEKYKTRRNASAAEQTHKSIRVTMEVAALLDEQRARMGRLVDNDPGMSWDRFLERWSNLLASSSDQVVRETFQDTPDEDVLGEEVVLDD